MESFIEVTDEILAKKIEQCRSQLIFLVPALSEITATALKNKGKQNKELTAVLVLDSEDDAYRLGYGDQKGAEILKELIQSENISIRYQTGIRLGLLIVDETVLFWSPTTKAVETERESGQPNGIVINGDNDVKSQVVDSLEGKEIGKKQLSEQQVKEIEKSLKENPPAPIDISNLSRILSSKIQFVECELRGAQWTEREIKISNLMLNADVPEQMENLFDTKIRPFSMQSNVAIEVHAMIQGKLAYDKTGEKITTPVTQQEIRRIWDDILKKYLFRIPNFGSVIKLSQKVSFQEEIKCFESILVDWVKGFKDIAEKNNEGVVNNVAGVIESRLRFSADSIKEKFKSGQIKDIIKKGLSKMRVTEPSVKVIYKGISWELIRDQEFLDMIKKNLHDDELKEWFSISTAALEKK